MLASRKIQVSAIVFVILCVIGLIVLIVAGNDTKKLATSELKSFTFFDIGANTTFSKGLRRVLSDRLGADAIQYRNIIDLEMNFKGFLKRYFPQLDELNQQLNYPPGERVDHNTVKLMYRHFKNKEAPFHYVELMFAKHSNKPLFIKILLKKDSSAIIDTIEKKYGQPLTIQWNDGDGRTEYWRNNRDYLITSIAPNRQDRLEYQIMIFYVDNLEELVNREEKERRRREEQRRQAGETAF
ncbi:MAG: hypothetical protein PVI06_09585 [Desulfobacterales bacterium]|jgi:hypothetical protein